MSEEEDSFTETNSMFEGFLLDPAKCGMLNLQDKQKLVHEIAFQSKDAPKMLYSFTRRELLEIICAEMGKERKYTGYTKTQMIEHLLKIISKKSKLNIIQNTLADSPAKNHIGLKRKTSSSEDVNHVFLGNIAEENVKTLLCRNVACKATLNAEDAFCKRCSCCICHSYDDNKDPSLWLTCGSDLPDRKDSCGISCHLQCALTNERSDILKDSCGTKLDGSFSCVSCGKINGLMRTWRKQLLVAKEARRVDILALRISLAHRILVGTKVYKEVHKIVDTAHKLLNDEVGPLDQDCAIMARGIVNRLSCGTEVQKLCTSAVECFDSMCSNLDPNCVEKRDAPTFSVHFEECLPTSVVIVLGYENQILKNFLGVRLWHRMSAVDYAEQPTFIVLRPEKRFKLENLYPSTQYFCKVSLFSSTGILATAEAKWVTPCEPINSLAKPTKPGEDHTRRSTSGSSKTASVVRAQKKNKMKDENHHQVESSNSNINSGDHPAEHPFSENTRGRFEGFISKPPLSFEAISFKNNAAVSPSTPSKPNETRQVNGLCCRKSLEESDYEYSVKVVRWLEREGHINENFRVKFLTWFSLKATSSERRVVSAFVNTFIDDPPSLADQLIHTFMDEICCDRKPH
ncbi:hypothetical protein L6164_015987 [Bauhinia variegata]|uniref:Uncharacterized protein n=1 Tax=Bauhinia variegata TaxID=167791 RepID=A0ACB9NR75_BAUVA|nr:hypothetical protein L6164_015987 [Bauhinia variegata]